MMYDFILFETLYNSVNHCKDLCNIATLLRDCGYKVAIADVFHEAECCKVEGIPHIQVQAKCNAILCPSTAKSSLGRYYENLKNRFIIDKYLCKVIEELSSKTKYFYAGTMMIGMPFMWLSRIPQDKIVFFWGLRSYYLTYYKLRKLKYETISSKIISSYFLKKENVRLFVSDEIIRKEFLSLGFHPHQLVLRPERTIENLDQEVKKFENYSSKCNILCIGTLRPQKRIDLCVKALNELNVQNIQLTIAGKASKEYGYDQHISNLIKDNSNIVRIDKRLTDEEFDNLINTCDYLLLCDAKQLSSVTNGTMMEALIAGSPIIAPDYDPYKTIVSSYGVGILYDITDKNSIQKAFVKAAETKSCKYKESIKRFASTLIYDDVLRLFKSEIRNALNETL